MEQQLSFADLEYARKRRRTKREKFLGEMDRLIPWNAFVERINRHAVMEDYDRYAGNDPGRTETD